MIRVGIRTFCSLTRVSALCAAARFVATFVDEFCNHSFSDQPRHFLFVSLRGRTEHCVFLQKLALCRRQQDGIAAIANLHAQENLNKKTQTKKSKKKTEFASSIVDERSGARGNEQCSTARIAVMAPAGTPRLSRCA